MTTCIIFFWLFGVAVIDNVVNFEMERWDKRASELNKCLGVLIDSNVFEFIENILLSDEVLLLEFECIPCKIYLLSDTIHIMSCHVASCRIIKVMLFMLYCFLPSFFSFFLP